MIELGTEVIDEVSGFTGIAVARHTYLNGCARISIQPKAKKDGSFIEALCFDEPQVKTLSKKKLKGDNSTGGPAKYPDRRTY